MSAAGTTSRGTASKALALGATSFDFSTRQGKRFMVVYEGKAIHFGAKFGSTFLDHKDEDKKRAWYARHSKIKNSEGKFVITDKHSPSYWAANLLW
jgi:hypothetical protein